MAHGASGKEHRSTQVAFDGRWLPAAEPAVYGLKGFKELRNFRYITGGIRQVLGYEEINTTAITQATYGTILNGIQIVNDRTQKTYTLVWTENGYVLKNMTAIPSQGDFASTVVHTDASGFDTGRFSLAPQGNICYSNGIESTYIWGGDEYRVGAFFLTDDETLDETENPKDLTAAVNNTLQTTGNIVTLSASQKTMLLLSSRKLSGAKFYIKTANAAAGATTSVKYYKGSWAAVSNKVDGTVSGAITMAQTGSITWDQPTDEVPFHYKDNHAYAYLFTVSGGVPVIYHVAAKPYWQPLVDLWDGVNRSAACVMLYHASKYEDYTLACSEEDSIVGTPIGADLGACTGTSYLYVGFDERASALQLQVAAGYVNTNAQTFAVSYWNGAAWTSLTVTDRTQAAAGTSFGKSGLIFWDSPAVGTELKTELFGKTLWFYRIGFSGLFSGTHGTVAAGVYMDAIYARTAQLSVPAYKFTMPYKGRLLGIGLPNSFEGSRIDYTKTNAPEVWNGEESSMDGMQSLYAGGSGDLIAGTSITNRVGNNVVELGIVLKHGSTHSISGSSPTGDDPLKCEELSPNIGIIAANTLDVASVGLDIASGATRNVAIWLSGSGPVMCDVVVIKPIKGLENYFDRTRNECINYDYAYKAWGRVNPQTLIYHLAFPSGSATACNVHVGLDLTDPERGWFMFDHSGAYVPQSGFAVADTSGLSYLYGGIADGHMVRMDYGATWNGVALRLMVEFGDFWLGGKEGGSVWQRSVINAIKLLMVRLSNDVTAQLYHFIDTDNYTIADFEVFTGYDFEQFTGYDFTPFTTAEAPIEFVVSSDSRRLFIGSLPVQWGSCRSHRIRVIIDNGGTETSIEPVGIGIRWQDGNEDLEAE